MNDDAKKTVRGVVLKGAMLGRKINFPTINVEAADVSIKYGVYVCVVTTPLGDYRGAMHFGSKSVLGNGGPSLEVHLLDFTGDLYGEVVTLDVRERIRDVKVFDGIEALKKQLRLDVECVRAAVIK